MPIYEYKCAECEARVEKMQKVTDAPLTVCEVCGGRLEKQWSLSGFQFKGAGWYVTDYSNKTKEAGAAAGGEKSDKTEKTENGEKTEKTSAAESTAATESASNKSNDGASDTKKDAVSKMD